MNRTACMITVLIATAAVLMMTGCATTGGSSVKSDEAALREAGALYEQAVDSGDVDLYMDRWDDSGIKMQPNGPSVVGKEAIRALTEKGFPKATRDMTLVTEEVVVAGDWGYCRGTYTVEVTPKAGGAKAHVNGKFLTIYRRQPDGSWKIYRDCYNSNVPAQ